MAWKPLQLHSDILPDQCDELAAYLTLYMGAAAFSLDVTERSAQVAQDQISQWQFAMTPSCSKDAIPNLMHALHKVDEK